ncbi:MAG: hypothetical protein J6X12_05320, partial [Paludibacteraceae bacterium]|nr:hypothetical protein [Paludibacteraceae bacterium]
GVNLCGTERAWFQIRNDHVYNAAMGETAPVKDSIVVKAQDVVISKVIDRQQGRIPSFTQFWYRVDTLYNADGSYKYDANGKKATQTTYLPYASNGVIDYTIEIHPIMADGSISCPAIKKVTAKAYNAPTGKFLVPAYVCENTEFEIKFQGVKSNPGDTLLFDYNGNSQFKLPYQAITNPAYTAGNNYLYYEREGGIARYNGFVEPRSAEELAATENSKNVAHGDVYSAYDSDIIKIYPRRFNTSEHTITVDETIAEDKNIGNKFKLNKASGVLTMASDGTYGSWTIWVRVENQYRCAGTVSKTIYCYTMDGINAHADVACEGEPVEIYASDGTSNLGRGYSFSFYELDKECGNANVECTTADTLNRLVNTTNSVKVNNTSYRHYKTTNLPAYGTSRWVDVVASRDYTSDIDGSPFTVTCKSQPVRVEVKPQAKPKLEVKFYSDKQCKNEISNGICPGSTVYMGVKTSNVDDFASNCKSHIQTVSCEDINYSVNRSAAVGNSPMEAYEINLPDDVESSNLSFSVVSTPYCGCGFDTTVSLTIFARPIASISSDGTSGVFKNNVLTLCEGATGNLIGSGYSIGTAPSWSWYDFTTNDKITTEELFKVGLLENNEVRSGSYYAIVQNTNTNCYSKPSNTISISVRQIPVVELNGSSTFVCPDGSAEVSVVSTYPLTREQYVLEAVSKSGDENNPVYNSMPNATISSTTNYSYALPSITFPASGVYDVYVRAIDKELSGQCVGVGTVQFKKASAPELDVTALKTDKQTVYESGLPCEGDEFYVKVVDVSGVAAGNDADMFVTLKSENEVVELQKDGDGYISINTFTADKIRKFTAVAENRYTDGTICTSPEATMSLGFNKRPTFNLTATTACEKLLRTYAGNTGGNYHTENGKTKFSVSNLVLDKSSNKDNKIKTDGYAWNVNGQSGNSYINSSEYPYEFGSQETQAVATLVVTDLNGCSSESVEKISVLNKRPRQIISAEAKCIGDNEVHISNAMDPNCDFTTSEVDFWYRLYEADGNVTSTDTSDIREHGLTGWLEYSGNKRLGESSGWRNAYPEHTFLTNVSKPMWACSRMRSVKPGNVCESEVECVLITPNVKPVFNLTLYDDNKQSTDGKLSVCPNSNVSLSVDVTDFGEQCSSATITIRDISTGNVVETQNVTKSNQSVVFDFGSVSSSLNYNVEVVSSCGCSFTKKASISVYPTISVSLTADGSKVENGYVYVCPGGKANLKAIVNDPAKVSEYHWYENDHLNVSVESLREDRPVGTYYVQAKDTNECLSSVSNTIIIEEVEAPTVSISAPEVVCENSSFAVSVVGPEAGITYTLYDVDDNNQISPRSSKKIDANSNVQFTIPSSYFKKDDDGKWLSENGQFLVIAENVRGCATTSDKVNVKLAEKPNVVIEAALSTIGGETQWKKSGELRVCPNSEIMFKLSHGVNSLQQDYSYTITPSNIDVLTYKAQGVDKAQLLDKKTIFTFAFNSEVLSGCAVDNSYVVEIAKPGSFIITDNCKNRYDGKPIVCPGGETEVTIYASNGISVDWSSGGLTLIEASGDDPANYDANSHHEDKQAYITFNPSTEKSYTFSGTDAHGCEVTASYDILIANPVNLDNIAVTLEGSPVPSLAVCENSIITLTASGSISNAKDGEYIKSYEWYSKQRDDQHAVKKSAGDGVSISQNMKVVSTEQVNGFHTDIQDVIDYYVSATSNFGCKSKEFTTTVTVDREPDIKLKNAPDPCIGTSNFEIVPTIGSEGQLFTITNLSTGEFVEKATSMPFTPAVAGQSYNFRIETVRGACNASEIISINAKAQPRIKVTDLETGLAQMTACPDVDGVKSEHYLKITVEDGKFGSIIKDNAATSDKIKFASDEPFSVGDSETGLTNYNGSETDAYYAKYVRPENEDHSTTLNSEYKITAQGSNGCQATVTFPIFIKPIPYAPEVTILRNGVETNNPSFCDGDKVTLVARSRNDNDKKVSFANTGTYRGKDGTFDSQSGTAVFEFIADASNVEAARVVTVSTTNEDECASPKDSITITVSNKMDLSVNVEENSNSKNVGQGKTYKACVGSSLKLTAVLNGGVVSESSDQYTVEWFASDKSTFLSSDFEYIVEPDPVYSKSYWVRVFDNKDPNGCSAWTNITVAPVAVPSITIIAENENNGKRVTSSSPENDKIIFCSGDVKPLNLSVIAPSDANWNWNNGADKTAIELKNLTSSETSVLSVTYKVGDKTCTTQRKFETIVKDKPKFDKSTPYFLTSVASDGSLITNPSKCVGDTVILNPHVSGEVVSYLWRNGATTPTLEVTIPSVENLTANKEYEFSVIATTADGCRDTLEEKLAASYVPEFTIQTAYACVGSPAIIKPVVNQGDVISFS